MQTGRRRPPPRRVKNRGRTTLIVMAVLVAAMVGLAVLLSRPANGALASSMPPASGPNTMAAQSLPATASQQEKEPLGPYEEAQEPPLYNAENPIPNVEDYQANLDLVDVGKDQLSGNTQQMEARAGNAFKAMREAAAADGISFFPHSGFRTHQRQKNNYEASIQRYLAQGQSREEAERLTQLYYAIPGTSEHEAGLAMDINGIEESFENTEAFRWLQENAADYGFILRYPKDAESRQITGISYEPWHYRYIGANYARDMKARGILTLEMYLVELSLESPDASAVQLPG